MLNGRVFSHTVTERLDGVEPRLQTVRSVGMAFKGHRCLLSMDSWSDLPGVTNNDRKAPPYSNVCRLIPRDLELGTIATYLSILTGLLGSYL